MRRADLLMALLSLLVATPAWADECVDPYLRTVTSPNKHFAVQFTPRKRDCSDDSCSDDPETTGELKGNPKAPTLTLFQLGPGKRRVEKWSRLIEDGYEPMGMSVSDDGQFVILSDRWCMSGLGEDVVVLLGSDGKRLQSWSLAEVLPADYAGAVVQTSDNIHWRGGISFDSAARTFSFQITVPNGEYHSSKTRYVDLLLDPEARTFMPRDEAAWTQARNMGRARVEGICADRKWRLRRASIPLSAPTVNDRKTWLNFAMELEKRLAYPTKGSIWDERLFLPAPSDPEYQNDLAEFRRRLTLAPSSNIAGNFYLVTPDLPNAHTVLREFLANEREINLRNDRFVVVGDDPVASDIAATIAAYRPKDIKIVALREVLQPATDQKDYDRQGKRACASLGEEKN